MKINTRNKFDVKAQVEMQLRKMYQLGKGTSKHLDKVNNPSQVKAKIYSNQTYINYRKWCLEFVCFCKDEYKKQKELGNEKYKRPGTIEACRVYIYNYIVYMQDKKYSAFTIKAHISALAKLYQLPIKDILTKEEFATLNIQDRCRQNIMRSRGDKKSDIHFNERRHEYFVEFCRSTGLRRKEITALTYKDIYQKDKRIYIHVRCGKGGKSRDVALCSYSKDFLTDLISKYKNAADKDTKVFDTIPTHADIHSYRADYCKRVYNAYARDINTLDKKDKYYCRGDKKGTVYDKNAMLIASRNLGHNRIDVIASNYLY